MELGYHYVIEAFRGMYPGLILLSDGLCYESPG